MKLSLNPLRRSPDGTRTLQPVLCLHCRTPLTAAAQWSGTCSHCGESFFTEAAGELRTGLRPAPDATPPGANDHAAEPWDDTDVVPTTEQSLRSAHRLIEDLLRRQAELETRLMTMQQQLDAVNVERADVTRLLYQILDGRIAVPAVSAMPRQGPSGEASVPTRLNGNGPHPTGLHN